MVNIKKQHNDIKYKVLSIRLSDKVILELKRRRDSEKSWNILFEKLLNIRK